MQKQQYLDELILEDRPTYLTKYMENIVVTYFGSKILFEVFEFKNNEYNSIHKIKAMDVLGINGQENPFSSLVFSLVVESKLNLIQNHFHRVFILNSCFTRLEKIDLVFENFDHRATSEASVRKKGLIMCTPADLPINMDGVWYDVKSKRIAISIN